MIVVVVDPTQESAEAEDAEGALLAAVTLLREAKEENPLQGFRPTVSFYDENDAGERWHIASGLDLAYVQERLDLARALRRVSR